MCVVVHRQGLEPRVFNKLGAKFRGQLHIFQVRKRQGFHFRGSTLNSRWLHTPPPLGSARAILSLPVDAGGSLEGGALAITLKGTWRCLQQHSENNLGAVLTTGETLLVYVLFREGLAVVYGDAHRLSAPARAS